MNSKMTTALGLSAVLAAAPFPADAGMAASKKALEACATSWVARLAEDQGAPMVFNLDPESDVRGRSLSRREVIHLDATDPVSRQVVARVDCVVDGRARVRELITVPLDAPDARLRSTQRD
jgi:hypothetical protein